MLDENSTYIEIDTDDKIIIDEFIKIGREQFNLSVKVITDEVILNELSKLKKSTLED